MHRALAIAAAATLLPAGPAPANDAPPASGGVTVVQPANNPQATTFASVKDRSYQFTVQGAYLYDSRFGQADCGHRDPPGHEPWHNEPNFTVDGSLASCVFLPFSQTHTYQWVQRGTGKPFVLNIPDGAYNTSDDTGPLVVVIEDVTP